MPEETPVRQNDTPAATPPPATSPSSDDQEGDVFTDKEQKALRKIVRQCLREHDSEVDEKRRKEQEANQQAAPPQKTIRRRGLFYREE